MNKIVRDFLRQNAQFCLYKGADASKTSAKLSLLVPFSIIFSVGGLPADLGFMEGFLP